GVGFGNCNKKPDVSATFQEAILLNGSVTATLNNATVQCIAGDGIRLESTANGSPILTMSSGTIQNTENGLHVSAGTATLTNTTIWYNYFGVQQDQQGTVDLSGGTTGGNTVVCSNSFESVFGIGGLSHLVGVSVLDSNGNALDADNVAWDTSPPDLFSCDAALTTCNCDNATCTNPGAAEGMDAVETSTGAISQNNPGLSTANCTIPGG